MSWFTRRKRQFEQRLSGVGSMNPGMLRSPPRGTISIKPADVLSGTGAGRTDGRR
jgi:hypothetical protein